MKIQGHCKELPGKLLAVSLLEGHLLKEMLKFFGEGLMRGEAEARIGEPKGKHSQERKAHFSGYRVRKFNSWLGTFYLKVPKVRKGGYILFFDREEKHRCGFDNPGAEDPEQAA